MNPLACNWELSPPFLLACHSKLLFCPFQRNLVRAHTIFWLSAIILDTEQYRVIWLNQSCKCILFSEPVSGTCGAELPQNGRDLTTKVGEQPWPQLVRCALIDCHTCGCIFQEDWIVVRNLGEEWYRLIGVRIGQGEDVNDFNLRTKELGCNYWSTYTKSGIGGVQVTSLHCDPIGVDNRSLGVKN